VSEDALFHPAALEAQLTLLIPVEQSRPTGPGWRSGVAAFPVRNEAATQTDLAWRKRQVDLRAERALYDGRLVCDLEEPVVLWRPVNKSAGTELTLTKIEFVPTGAVASRGPGGVAVAHLAVADDAGKPHAGLEGGAEISVRTLNSAISDLARPDHQRPMGIAPPLRTCAGLDVFHHHDAVVSSFVVLSSQTVRALAAHVGDTGWTGTRFWAYSLARGSAPGTGMLRRGPLPATPGEVVSFPHRLAVVDRAGLSILTTRDPADHDIRDQYMNFRAPFRSIYTDLLLLGMLQQIQVVDLALALDEMGDPVSDPGRFRLLDDRLRVVRNRYWWTSVTRWHVPDPILRAYQRQNSVRESLQQLVEDARDFGNAVDRQYQRDLNDKIILFAKIGVVGALAGSFGAVASWLAAFGTGHWGASLAIAISAPACALALAATLIYLTAKWPAEPRGIGARSTNKDNG